MSEIDHPSIQKSSPNQKIVWPDSWSPLWCLHLDSWSWLSSILIESRLGVRV